MTFELIPDHIFRDGFAVGDHVCRTQGRPANIGRTGTVTFIASDYVGSGGDCLVIVKGDDGSEWNAYTRQIVKTA